MSSGAAMLSPARRESRLASAMASDVPLERSSCTATKPSSATATSPVTANCATVRRTDRGPAAQLSSAPPPICLPPSTLLPRANGP